MPDVQLTARIWLHSKKPVMSGLPRPDYTDKGLTGSNRQRPVWIRLWLLYAAVTRWLFPSWTRWRVRCLMRVR
jgi:hypothetical protein